MDVEASLGVIYEDAASDLQPCTREAYSIHTAISDPCASSRVLTLT